MSVLKINFHKSDIYGVEIMDDDVKTFEEIFTCNSGCLPMKYLGVPADKKSLKNSDWRPTKEKMGNKLSPWHGKWLAMGERTTLINSSLSSVPLYMLSFYRIPVGPKEYE